MSEATAIRVRLLRDEQGQYVEIPDDFELPGENVIVTREGDRLIVEPMPSLQTKLR